MKSVTRTTGTIAIFTALTLLGTTSADAGGVELNVDWSMPDRYGLDSDGDGVTDALDTIEEIQPASWRVRFDACGSASSDAGDPIATFEVEVAGEPAGSFSDCEFEIEMPGQGAFPVAVTAVTASGARVTAELVVRVRDWLVVGLGDSYASGEGVPDVPMTADGLDRALAAYAAVDEARGRVDDLRRELEDALEDVASAADHVDDARSALEDAADDVARRFASLNRAIDDLRDVETDVRPVQNALANFKHDCIDDFGVFRCPIATGELIAALVSFGVSAAAEIVSDGYNAVKSLIDNAIAAAQDAVSAARSAYNSAVAAKDAAQDALDDAVDAFADFEEARDAVAAALTAAEDAAADSQIILDRITSEARAVWQDEDCHRSAFSAQARAALALERLDPRSSVTFVHLACSGATTIHGSGLGTVVGQLDALRDLIGAREVDAVIMSIGGNDAGFSTIIESLIRHQGATGLDVDFDAIALTEALCPFVPGLSDACATFTDELPEESAATILADGLLGLPAGYAEVAERLAEFVEPDRVFITQYPNATRRDDGAYCDPAAAPGISSAEWQWLDEVATTQINAAVAEGAAEHGWSYVETIYDLFESHGYCADAHWMVRLEESALLQGDFSGTAHPNASGHEALGEELGAMLAANLDGDGSMTPFLRGDCNADGEVDISDAAKTLAILFLGDAPPVCEDACDANDDGATDISDPLATLGDLFLGTGTIPAPGRSVCGVDPSADELGCGLYDVCP